MSSANGQENNLQFSARVLIADHDAVARAAMATRFDDAGWTVQTVADGAAALAHLAPCPSLALLDLAIADPAALEVIAATRRLPLPWASVPVIALATTRPTGPSVLIAHGFDAVLARPATPDDIARVAAQWDPRAEERSLDRLAHSFGAAQIASMIARLRTLFATAVAAIDAGEVRDLAHRIAGVAGTLGFTRAGQAWAALSDRNGGDLHVQAAARCEARRAIALIDRRLAPEKTGVPST